MTNSAESQTESGKMILSQEQYQKSLYALNHLICVTKENYRLLYLDLLARVAEWLQTIPSSTETDYQKPYGLFSLSFARAIAVLKHRRAYMLPPGANAETCYQQQDMWTYALFTAALLQDCWQKPNDLTANLTAQDNFELAKQFIPEVGWCWLQRFEDLYQDWCVFLNHKVEASTNNVIAAIIEKAETALLNKPMAANQQPFALMLYPTTQVELNNQPSTTLRPEQIEQPTTDTPNLEPTAATLGDQFITWLKQALADGVFKINHMEGNEHVGIHATTDGILLMMPELWERYLASHSYITEDWQALTDNNTYFVNGPGKTFLHAYCIGEWHRRRVFKGLLLKTHLLFEADKLPPINDQLSPDLMSALK